MSQDCKNYNTNKKWEIKMEKTCEEKVTSYPECGEVSYKVEDKDSQYYNILKKLKNILLSTAIGCFLISTIFFYKGYDAKNNYYNSEYSTLNENAYVGGDAYNYIINGTYFMGYSVIASAFMLSGVLLCCTTVMVFIKIKLEKENLNKD